MWNIARFAEGHLDERTPDLDAPAYRDADHWILAEAGRVAETIADDMEAYRYDSALRTLRQFVWHDLADDYLELVKGRLYEGRPGERDAARHALYTTLSASIRMLSPFSPFVTEGLWRNLPGTEGSVHGATWPELDIEIDAEAERAGSLIVEVASGVRGWKSDEGKALNAELERVEIYPEESFERAVDTYDLSEAVNAPVYVETGSPNVELVPVEVEADHSVIGPEFRDRAGAVLGALESIDPAEVKAQKDRHGEIELQANGEVVVVDGDAVTVSEEHRAESGEEVAVLELDVATVIIVP